MSRLLFAGLFAVPPSEYKKSLGRISELVNTTYVLYLLGVVFLFCFSLMEVQEVCYSSGTSISSHSSGFLGVFFLTFFHAESVDLYFKRLMFSPKWVEEIIFL